VWTYDTTSLLLNYCRIHPQDGHTSNIREAATKYRVTYTPSLVVGSATVHSTATVRATPTTGGAGARVKMGAVATGILMVAAGGLLFNA
jgi:hypothetical protein